jgi:hypothetical protein
VSAGAAPEQWQGEFLKKKQASARYGYAQGNRI